MAIFRRDRSFAKIIDEVELETIPVHFIKRLRLYCEDGTAFIFEKEDLEKVESIEQILLTVNISQPITDMNIELDYDGIEEDVTQNVNKLLNNDKKDD